jgi:anti-anti-sigma factor
MGIQKWSDNIILLNLAAEPHLGEEVQAVTEMLTAEKPCDVVIDFADVEIVTSSSIAKLLKLRKTVNEINQRLVFSSVSKRTMTVFSVIGLEEVFEFVDDQFLALAGLQMVT